MVGLQKHEMGQPYSTHGIHEELIQNSSRNMNGRGKVKDVDIDETINKLTD